MRKIYQTVLVVLTLVAAPLAASGSVQAMVAGGQALSAATTQSRITKVRVCWQRVGPFRLQSQAYRAMRIAQARGYRTSGVFGVGGVIARPIYRRYYFNVFYRC